MEDKNVGINDFFIHSDEIEGSLSTKEIVTKYFITLIFVAALFIALDSAQNLAI
jgi:hypothetical protein